MSEPKTKLYLSILGKWGCLGIGKDVIKTLGIPTYITFKEKDNYDSLIFFPCEKEDVMSFKVPESFLEIGAGRKNFRINSKYYVQNLLDELGLDRMGTYTFSGAYSDSNNSVVFKLRNKQEN